MSWNTLQFDPPYVVRYLISRLHVHVYLNRHKIYCSFHVIACTYRPPLGNLRFKSPVEPEPWMTPLRAVRQPASCSQIVDDDSSIDAPTVAPSEDCLYVNIFVPGEEGGGVQGPRRRGHGRRGGGTTKDLLSIIVYLHGGMFHSGQFLCCRAPTFALIPANVILMRSKLRKNMIRQ